MVFFLFLYYLISDGRISFLGFILYRKFPFQDSSLSGTILFRNYSIQNESFSGIILIRNYSIQIESFFRNHPFQELSITGNVLSKTLSMQKIFCYFFRQACWKLLDRPQGVQLTTPMPRCHTQICLPGNLSGH